MKYKILHLPTGTLLYKLKLDLEESTDKNKYGRLYSEYELENKINGYEMREGTSEFPSESEAQKYITHWSNKERFKHDTMVFGPYEQDTLANLSEHHCVIMRYE